MQKLIITAMTLAFIGKTVFPVSLNEEEYTCVIAKGMSPISITSIYCLPKFKVVKLSVGSSFRYNEINEGPNTLKMHMANIEIKMPSNILIQKQLCTPSLFPRP